METNKWLWQPRKNGPIHLRVTHTTLEGQRKSFVRSLRTNHWPSARKIRDTEFAPIILDMQKAMLQLELIHELYPQLEERLQAGQHGGYGPEQSNDKRTNTALSEVYASWCDAMVAKGGNYAVSQGTAKRYTAIGGVLVAHIGQDTPVSAVTQQDIVDYRDVRLGAYAKSKKTVELELIAIRGLFRYAVEQSKAKENPAKGVSVKRTKAERTRETRRKKRRPPTHGEADKICKQFPADHKRFTADDFQDYAMFARYTGMRQAEIAHIRVEDLQTYEGSEFVDVILANPAQYQQQYGEAIPDGHALCIYVTDTDDHTTKTGLERIVPVSNRLLPVIRRRVEQVGKGPLFPFAEGDSGASFGRLWLKKVKKIGDDLTMHGFRHYAASEMENNGVESGVSAAVLGHVESSVHEGYVHRRIAVLKEGVDQVY
ncbi:MAG: tyrosine-type recombinase/integrase [Lentisphaerae bacterium]|nr:tyrosine-type recombinase/integrase [Lentisphaerota bacterium]MBT4818811.1 tyrosine-type recombinase/integrase [Lentisphaerota bacterium]MBT5604645.1 tyrosine-type recombinase/integrase [Lentisphaerota bacterium]MBT7057433.1 tyrosine-type recombinase/integrase [Lentisphaerota bacterium]MBT7847206.1 tyrosine-type recombinase/integrase [Lentisphaerota bacterium]